MKTTKKHYTRPCISEIIINEHLMNGVSGEGGSIIIPDTPSSGGDASSAAAKGNNSSMWDFDEE